MCSLVLDSHDFASSHLDEYLNIAQNAKIDDDAQIVTGAGKDAAQKNVHAVGTNAATRLGERIFRTDTDRHSYRMVRKDFLCSIMMLYGVEKADDLPKTVRDAFVDREVVTGRPLTKRRIAIVLDAVRRDLAYQKMDDLKNAFNLLKEVAKTDKKVMAELAPQKYRGADLDDSDPLDETEIEDGEAVDPGAYDLAMRVRTSRARGAADDHSVFAANISGKMVGEKADAMMRRFETFSSLYDKCLESAGGNENYATEWLKAIYSALTTPQRTANDHVGHDVHDRFMDIMGDDEFLAGETSALDKALEKDLGSVPDEFELNLDEEEDVTIVQRQDDHVEKWQTQDNVNASVSPRKPTFSYTFDQAFKILEKWSGHAGAEKMINGGDIDVSDALFDKKMALSFGDPKLTAKVQEGEKRFAACIRRVVKDAYPKNEKIDEKELNHRVDGILKRFNEGTVPLGEMRELWSVQHERLEQPDPEKIPEDDYQSIKNIVGNLWNS